MPRFRQNNKMLFSTDDVGVDKIYSRNYDVDSVDEVTDDFSAGNSRTFTLGHGVSVSVDFAGLTSAKLVYVESDKRITVTLNAGDPIPVVPRVNASVEGATLPGRMLLWTDSLVTIGLQNGSSTDDAKVTVVLGG